MTYKPALFLPMKRIWLTAILIAVVLGIPAAVLCQSHPWIVAIPITLGTLLIVWLEVVADTNACVENPSLFSMPTDFRALSGYRGLAALLLPTGKEEDQQDVFSFLPAPKKRKQRKEAIKIADPNEGELYIIDCERFVALMVDK